MTFVESFKRPCSISAQREREGGGPRRPDLLVPRAGRGPADGQSARRAGQHRRLPRRATPKQRLYGAPQLVPLPSV